MATAFAAAFIAGSALIFWLLTAAGMLLELPELPWRTRAAIAAGGLLFLALVDLVAIGRSTYCPLSWRRQTPRTLMRRRYDLRVVALVWGFDTGLVVTTFRVAAVSWGALFLSVLGLSHGWTGISYGLGFAIPFLFLILRPRLGRASRSAEEPGLEAMLRKRPMLQAVSATLLCVASAIIVSA